MTRMGMDNVRRLFEWLRNSGVTEESVVGTGQLERGISLTIGITLETRERYMQTLKDLELIRLIEQDKYQVRFSEMEKLSL